MVIFNQTLTNDMSYLNIFLVVRTDRMRRISWHLKQKKNSLKFQRKGKSYQWNKTNLTNSLIYRIRRMASASVRRREISGEGRKYF